MRFCCLHHLVCAVPGTPIRSECLFPRTDLTWPEGRDHPSESRPETSGPSSPVESPPSPCSLLELLLGARCVPGKLDGALTWPHFANAGLPTCGVTPFLPQAYISLPSSKGLTLRSRVCHSVDTRASLFPTGNCVSFLVRSPAPRRAWHTGSTH